MTLGRNQRLLRLLQEIRAELEALDLWQQEAPPAEALASTQPFCIDTLNFSEWLQWLLIPRLQEMVRRELPLPANSQIHPMAEEAFRGAETDRSRLLDLVGQLDQLLSIRH